MRKLKLQMNILLDDKWDPGMTKLSMDNLKNVDCIFLGRNTAAGFIPDWAGVASNPKDEFYKLGKRLTEIPKVVFSKKLKISKWDNATIVKGNMVEAVRTLKKKKGKDIIVYGGDSFVSSLIQHDLIDEFYLLVNPVAIGNGEPIFNPLKNDLRLTLVQCKAFASGAVLLQYVRTKK